MSGFGFQVNFGFRTRIGFEFRVSFGTFYVGHPMSSKCHRFAFENYIEFKRPKHVVC